MLEIKNLTKIYRTKGGADVRALDEVSLTFGDTGMVFLLGKSGSGKSTLLNLIGGLDRPDGGEIILQKAVDILPGDTPEILQRRVMGQAEWILLPQAAELVAEKLQK